MNMPLRAGYVHADSLPLGAAEVNVHQAKVAEQPARSSLVMAMVLGLGGILTLAWTGFLLWLAGYLIGYW